MVEGLLTRTATGVLDQIKPGLRRLLSSVNARRFVEAEETLADVREVLVSARAGCDDGEDLLTDLFVLDRYVDLLSAYSCLWEKIVAQQFSASWDRLQDTLDLLRLVKRFSALDISYFENQLLELERAYPYKVFCSIAATVRYFECSLCGRDIDSDECPHRRGHLYAGVMAYAIARDLVDCDHVAMVPNPQDKRCVVCFEDAAEQFRVIRYISELISSEQLRISDLACLDWTKRKHPNPEYGELARNDRCYCGSNRKFKHCCISKREIEEAHVEVVSQPRDIEDAVG